MDLIYGRLNNLSLLREPLSLGVLVAIKHLFLPRRREVTKEHEVTTLKIYSAKINNLGRDVSKSFLGHQHFLK